MEKTLITNTRKSKAKFLGAHIKQHAYNGLLRYRTIGNRALKISGGNLSMTMPTEEIINRLKTKGFLSHKSKPKSCSMFLPLPVKDIILRFRVILYGYLNYFSFIDNPKGLLNIYGLLKSSLQLTICRKKDMGIREFLKSFGPDVTLKIRRRDGQVVQLDFKAPNVRRQPEKFYVKQRRPDPLLTKV